MAPTSIHYPARRQATTCSCSAGSSRCPDRLQTAERDRSAPTPPEPPFRTPIWVLRTGFSMTTSACAPLIIPLSRRQLPTTEFLNSAQQDQRRHTQAAKARAPSSARLNRPRNVPSIVIARCVRCPRRRGCQRFTARPHDVSATRRYVAMIHHHMIHHHHPPLCHADLGCWRHHSWLPAR